MRKLGKKVTLDKRSLQAYKFCVCSNCPCPYMIYGKSQKSLNFLCFCGYYNRQMSAKYYNGQILKNIFLYNYIAG